MASIKSKDAAMTDVTLTEYFPNSEIEFDQRFSNTEACYEYLARIKWPDGYTCEKCGHKAYWLSSNNIYICKRCEHQISLTAGTIMHGTKKPITYWFKAMWWFTTRKSGVNAVNLQELLGLGSYHTAWSWLQKLRRCTVRKDREKLSGRVEVDEFFIGGKKAGKRGRGAEGKTIALVAIERYTAQDPKPKILSGKLAVFDCRLPLTVQPIHWKLLSTTTLKAAVWLSQTNSTAIIL